jgi:hypothetical protein
LVVVRLLRLVSAPSWPFCHGVVIRTGRSFSSNDTHEPPADSDENTTAPRTRKGGRTNTRAEARDAPIAESAVVETTSTGNPRAGPRRRIMTVTTRRAPRGIRRGDTASRRASPIRRRIRTSRSPLVPSSPGPWLSPPRAGPAGDPIGTPTVRLLNSLTVPFGNIPALGNEKRDLAVILGDRPHRKVDQHRPIRALHPGLVPERVAVPGLFDGPPDRCLCAAVRSDPRRLIAVTARKPTRSRVGGSAYAPCDNPPTAAGPTPQWVLNYQVYV